MKRQITALHLNPEKCKKLGRLKLLILFDALEFEDHQTIRPKPMTKTNDQNCDFQSGGHGASFYASAWAETWPFWDIFGKKSRFSKFPYRPSGSRCAPEDKFQKFRFLTENVPKRPTIGAGAARTTMYL